MRSFSKISCFALLLAMGITCASLQSHPQSPPGINQDVILPINPTAQHYRYGCWADVVSMITAYYGKPMEQCAVASKLPGQTVDCCAITTTSTTPNTCNRPAYNEEITALLLGAGFKSRFTETNGLSEIFLQDEIMSRRPVILKYDYADTVAERILADRLHRKRAGQLKFPNAAAEEMADAIALSGHVMILSQFKKGNPSTGKPAIYGVIEPSSGTVVYFTFEALRYGSAPNKSQQLTKIWVGIEPKSEVF